MVSDPRSALAIEASGLTKVFGGTYKTPQHGRSDPYRGQEDQISAPARGREDERVFDSPTSWVARHVRNYVESGGEKGHAYHGMPTLLLTTHGRKSGKLRRTALIYGRDGDRYVLVASNAGASRHPAWYLNLLENPDVGIQVGPDRFSARARAASAEEKPRLWRLMASIFAQYDAYQKKASRNIPVVIVERVG
jgi:deazaflavin-dependent oxidoreductase (nitroreductase family)